MKWKTTFVALAAGAIMAFLSGGSASAADLKCGANTGKAATGEPIVIGGIVSITGLTISAPRDLPPRPISTASTPTAASTAARSNTSSTTTAGIPSKRRRIAAKLINDEKAVALVGNIELRRLRRQPGTYEKADIMVGRRRRRAARLLLPEELRHDKRGPARQQHEGADVSRQAVTPTSSASSASRRTSRMSASGRATARPAGSSAMAAKPRSSCSIRVRSTRPRWSCRRWRSSPT